MDNERLLEEASAILKLVKREDIKVLWDPEENDNGAFIIGGHFFIARCELERATLVGALKVPGWEVYTFVMQNNYPHEPDDVDKLTVADGERFDAMVLEAVYQIMQCEIENRPFTDKELAEMRGALAAEEN